MKITDDPKTRDALELEALEYFGAAMHAVMDRFSPAHCDFQVYDTSQYAIEVNPAPGLLRFGLDMLIHKNDEARDPSAAEIDVMGTEIRY